ncbi:MAG: four helix bundle protein [Fibromonadaceae bacterium]|nr:four helix bundle protein [Fibromonadaceae bacterium]
MKTIYSPKDLNAWKEAVNLVKQIYLVTKNFPKEEIYGITNQIRRASVSVPSNNHVPFPLSHVPRNEILHKQGYIARLFEETFIGGSEYAVHRVQVERCHSCG